MKVAYIGSFKRIYDEEGIARSLEALGVTVHRFEEWAMELETIDEIVDLNPDFVLFAKLKMPPFIREGLISKLKDSKIKSVCWIPDLYFGLGREYRIVMKDPIFRADIVCTPDGGHNARFEKHGVNHRVLRQGIYHEEVVLGEKKPLPYEIVFVGTENPEYPYRTRLMRFLGKTYGDKFEWVGRDNPHQVRTKDLADLYASVKIVIGDAVFSPRYWSNRVYETIGRGGFMIHPKINGLEEEFEYYKHFVPYTYGDFEGLVEKINYFLEHDNEREQIRLAGFEHCKNNYTLIHRCKELLKFV